MSKKFEIILEVKPDSLVVPSVRVTTMRDGGTIVENVSLSEVCNRAEEVILSGNIERAIITLSRACNNVYMAKDIREAIEDLLGGDPGYFNRLFSDNYYQFHLLRLGPHELIRFFALSAYPEWEEEG